MADETLRLYMACRASSIYIVCPLRSALRGGTCAGRLPSALTHTEAAGVLRPWRVSRRRRRFRDEGSRFGVSRFPGSHACELTIEWKLPRRMRCLVSVSVGLLDTLEALLAWSSGCDHNNWLTRNRLHTGRH